MAKIRGVIIKLDGDTSGLNKSLSDVNGKIKDTEKQLKDVDRLLKLDPKNTELLAQKQKLLADAIGQSKEKLDTLKKAEEQLKSQGVDENSEQFMALQREIIATENNLKKLQTEASKTVSVFDKIGAATKKIADGAQKVADKTKKLSATGAAVAGGLLAAGGSSIKTADDLATLSARMGVSTDTLQKFAYASDMVDVSTEELAGAFSKMKKNIGAAPEAFDALGVSVKDADGEFRNLEEIFFETLSALSEIGNETERDLAAMELFGKSADTLATVIDDGGEGLRLYGEKAAEMGLILSEDTIGKLTATGDKIDEMKVRTAATIAEVGSKLVDELGPTIDVIVGKIGNVIEFIGTLDADTLNTIMIVGLVVAAISPLASLIGGVSTAIGGVSTAIQFLLANPVVALIAAVVGFVALIATKGDEIQSILQGVDDFLQGVFERDWSETFGVLGHIINVFLVAVEFVWNSVKNVFNGVIDFIRGVFTGDWERAFKGLGNIVTGTLDGVKSVFDRLTGWLKGVFSRDWTKELGIFGNAINAFGKTVTTIIDGVKKTFGGIIDFIKNVFSGNWKGAWESVKSIFSGIWETFGGIVKAPINTIIGLINGLIDGINWCIRGINSLSFEIPSWVPFIGGSRVGFNIAEVGKIAYLAKGGVLTAGNAVVGENGPELLSMSPQGAVVQPLTNQTTNQNYGGVTINVYGAPGQNIEQLAQIVSDEIANATRRQEAVFA